MLPGFETKITNEGRKLAMKKHNKNRRNVDCIGADHHGAHKTRILILGSGFAGLEAARDEALDLLVQRAVDRTGGFEGHGTHCLL